MANSTTSIVIRPSTTFNRSDTFVFGSWVCTTDGVGSFQRHLTMTLDPETRLVTLSEVATGQLVKKSVNFRSATKLLTLRLNPPPTRIRCHPGSKHVS
jgi:hypothetical protein